MDIEKVKEKMKFYIENYNDSMSELFKTVLSELEKKETLINTMQAEFERLEGIEDNTSMLKHELKQKDKIIDEMAGEIIRILYHCNGKVGKYKTPYVNESISKTRKNIKEYFTKKVEGK